MLKKLALVAMMALGLVAMLAPTAQANKQLTVLSEGVPLTETTDVALAGKAKFIGEFGGIEAVFHLNLHIPANNTGTGTIDSVAMTEPALFGLIGHCSASIQVSGLPWTVHAEETTEESPVKTLDITDPQLKMKLSGFFCPPELDITGGTVIATPDNPNAISSVTLSGSVTTTIGDWGASGTLNVAEPHTGVLGLG